MRALAKGLRVSVITTKRAYEELEKDGFIVTVTGKGSFAAEQNTEAIREKKLKEIENKIYSIWEKAKLCGRLSFTSVFFILFLYGIIKFNSGFKKYKLTL